VAVQFPQRSEWWLFDCGEGTQHQLLRLDELRPSQLRRIFITHMHGDHIYGLPGLLASCGLGSAPEHIDIYGPPGLEEYLKAVLRYSETRIPYGFRVHTVETGLILQEPEYSVFCAPLDHRVPAFGYRVVEQESARQLQCSQSPSRWDPLWPSVWAAQGRPIHHLAGPLLSRTGLCRGSHSGPQILLLHRHDFLPQCC
jgi:ribonuclease Z